MDHRAHERGVGMLNTPYVKKDTIKNFFPVPNAVFDLGLHHMEINIYAYLLRIEDRRTYQCLVSYPTIARKLGISVNTVAKYVAALEEHGLIRTERTEIITRDGLKRNGCLRYTILPIGTREVFAELFTGKGNVVFLRFLLLHPNGEHGVLVQLAALTELFHPLRL